MVFHRSSFEIFSSHLTFINKQRTAIYKYFELIGDMLDNLPRFVSTVFSTDLTFRTQTFHRLAFFRDGSVLPYRI